MHEFGSLRVREIRRLASHPARREIEREKEKTMKAEKEKQKRQKRKERWNEEGSKQRKGRKD